MVSRYQPFEGPPLCAHDKATHYENKRLTSVARPGNSLLKLLLLLLGRDQMYSQPGECAPHHDCYLPPQHQWCWLRCSKTHQSRYCTIETKNTALYTTICLECRGTQGRFVDPPARAHFFEPFQPSALLSVFISVSCMHPPTSLHDTTARGGGVVCGGRSI